MKTIARFPHPHLILLYQADITCPTTAPTFLMTCPFTALMCTTPSASISTSATIATTLIVSCLSLSFASGIIVHVVINILVIPILLLELILVIFKFLKPPQSLKLRVFFKLLKDDCDEDRKEIMWLVRSEDVDGANTQIG